MREGGEESGRENNERQKEEAGKENARHDGGFPRLSGPTRRKKKPKAESRREKRANVAVRRHAEKKKGRGEMW